ncbi:MAG: glucosamine-6-phosphate deaminase, partial [Planctomycetota bacterium]|nr:glucosamine-6-phosphate deaminase [Planctomycetota bacterium]
MRVVIENSAEAVSQFVADRIAQWVRHHPSCVLGLATGSTPLGTYRELIRLHREGSLDLSAVTTFNLDEYVGLSPSHDQSYQYFMQDNLFQHVNLSAESTHVPDGLATDLASHCLQYEEAIRDAGGIDLQLLGIGTDGHIAFNEPGSSLGSRTRLKSLTHETIRDNARFFENESEV